MSSLAALAILTGWAYSNVTPPVWWLALSLAALTVTAVGSITLRFEMSGGANQPLQATAAGAAALGGSSSMSTTDQPTATPGWVLAARIVASSFCVLVLAIAIPNLGSVTLPNHRIGYGWRDALSVSIMITPLIVIIIGAVCSRAIEFVGWALAFALLIWMFIFYSSL